MSAIPHKQRETVNYRDNNQCQRCGKRGNHWHHRRTRSIHDEHTHCACNGIILCFECHGWVHTNVELAREEGLIVSRYQTSPGEKKVLTFNGWRKLECA